MRICPSCQNEDGLSHLWDTHIIRCPRCELGYIERLPTKEEIEALYSAEFFKGDASYADYVADKEGLQRNFRHRLRDLLKYSQGGKLFEAGCAHGFFLELAREHWDVKGIDIAEEAAKYARDELGLDVQAGDFESRPPEPNTYDVIAMWDTIEHLYDPVLAVRKSAEALRPGGVLALTTGDIDALVPRLQRKSWRLIHPTHLYYFSRRSMTWLLEAHGLEVVHISHPGNYRSLSQMMRVLTFGRSEKSWQHRLLPQVERLPFLDLQIMINLHDIMFAVARKPA